MTTDRQKKAIEFCNNVLSDKFKGDIDNFAEVSNYLALHLDEAKKKKLEPKKILLSTTRLHEYSRYISENDFEDIVDPHWIVE